MTTSNAPENNCVLIARLQADTGHSEQLHRVTTCAADQERINTLPSTAWSSFFLDEPDVTEDCMNARDSQAQSPRDSF